MTRLVLDTCPWSQVAIVLAAKQGTWSFRVVDEGATGAVDIAVRYGVAFVGYFGADSFRVARVGLPSDAAAFPRDYPVQDGQLLHAILLGAQHLSLDVTSDVLAP